MISRRTDGAMRAWRRTRCPNGQKFPPHCNTRVGRNPPPTSHRCGLFFNAAMPQRKGRLMQYCLICDDDKLVYLGDRAAGCIHGTDADAGNARRYRATNPVTNASRYELSRQIADEKGARKYLGFDRPSAPISDVQRAMNQQLGISDALFLEWYPDGKNFRGAR